MINGHLSMDSALSSGKASCCGCLGTKLSRENCLCLRPFLVGFEGASGTVGACSPKKNTSRDVGTELLVESQYVIVPYVSPTAAAAIAFRYRLSDQPKFFDNEWREVHKIHVEVQLHLR